MHAVCCHLCHQVMLLCPMSTFFGGIAIKIQVTLAGLSGYVSRLAQHVKISSNPVFLTSQLICKWGPAWNFYADIKVHEDDAFMPASKSYFTQRPFIGMQVRS